MIWQYTGERRRLFGKWCYPGNQIENPTQPAGDWFPLGEITSQEESLEKVIGQKKESDDIIELKKELSKMKMKELRKIGDPYNAKDTKKSELIDEIIQAKLDRGEL